MGRLKPDKWTDGLGIRRGVSPDYVSNRIALITSGDGQTLSFLRLRRSAPLGQKELLRGGAVALIADSPLPMRKLR